MDVGTAGIAVQVTLLLLEVAAAVVGHEIESASVHGTCVGGCTAGSADVQVGNVTEVGAAAGVVLAEQVDPVTTGATACIQVLVNDCPALVLIGGLQRVYFAFAATDEHQILDVLRCTCRQGGRYREQQQKGCTQQKGVKVFGLCPHIYMVYI